MVDIESGLEALAQEIRERNIHSIAIPALGTSLGGLNWAEVRPLIEAMLEELSGVQIVIFNPGGAPADGRANRSSNVPSMTPGRAVLVRLMHRYLGGLLDPFVTLLEVHKLMYFMQEAGEQLRLNYRKAQYGPYAPNMGHVLKAIEGHLISGYADGGDAPGKQLELVPGAVADANTFLELHPATRSHFDRVSELVEGFESPFGLELLSTVHWVASMRPSATEEEVIAQAYAWGDQKRQFTERQIRLALQRLKEKGWLEADSPVGDA